MRKAAAFAVVLSFSAAGAAQPSAQPPAPQPQAEPAKPRLNLQLNEADLRALPRSAPLPQDADEPKAARDLPSLGGDARTVERARSSERTPNTPYPRDTEIR